MTFIFKVGNVSANLYRLVANLGVRSFSASTESQNYHYDISLGWERQKVYTLLPSWNKWQIKNMKDLEIKHGGMIVMGSKSNINKWLLFWHLFSGVWHVLVKTLLLNWIRIQRLIMKIATWNIITHAVISIICSLIILSRIRLVLPVHVTLRENRELDRSAILISLSSIKLHSRWTQRWKRTGPRWWWWGSPSPDRWRGCQPGTDLLSGWNKS